MASTNKTTNYELSQFLGTDKPAWLSDYNTDMSKIDTQMKANADAATAAGGTATAATTAIGTLASLTTDVKTDLVSAINEVDSNADTAQNTATNAATTANTAASGITSLTNYLNLGATNVSLTNSDMSLTGTGTIRNTSNLHIVGNTDNSLVKIYGNVIVDSTTPNSNITVTISNTGLTPTSNITINACGIVTKENTNDATLKYVDTLTYTINTNGTITVSLTATAANTVGIKFIACVIFLKNFGD